MNIFGNTLGTPTLALLTADSEPFAMGDEIVHRLQSTRRVYWTVVKLYPGEGIGVESSTGNAYGFIAARDYEMYEAR